MDLIREMNSRFNRAGNDVDSWIGYYHEDVEFHMPSEWPEDSVYYGRDGVRRLAALWWENFDDYRWDEEQLIDCGEFVVGLWRTRGRIKDGGAWIEAPVGTIWRISDDAAIRVDSYFTWAEALAVAGLAEREHQPQAPAQDDAGKRA